MKALIIVLSTIYFMLFMSTSHAQTNKKTAHEIASKLSDRAWYYSTRNTDSSMFYARKALSISRHWNFRQMEAYALSDIGKAFTLLEIFDSAEFYLKKSLTLRLLLGDFNDITSGYNNLAKYYQKREHFDTAIYYFQTGLKVAKRKNLLSMQSTLLNGIGICYLGREDYSNAEELLLEALKIEESLPKASHLAERYQNLGNLYVKMKQYDQALKYYENSSELYERDNNREGLIDVLANEGSVLHLQGHSTDATEKLNSAMQLSKDYGFLDNRLSIMNNLGKLFLDIGNYDQAKVLFEQGMELALAQNKKKASIELAGNYVQLLIFLGKFERANQILPTLQTSIEQAQLKPFLPRFYIMTSQVLAGLGKYVEAHDAQKRYIQIIDSLHKVADQTQASLAQMEQNKRDKIILEKENVLQASELQRQKAQNRNQWLSIAILVLFLLAIVIVASLKLRNARVKNTALAEKKKSEEKLQDLLRQVDVKLLETQLEANRSASHRIGQDLHDNLGSKLAVVQMSIGGIRTKMGSIEEELAKRFDEVEQFLEDSCRDLRDIAHNLQDRELKYRGLVIELDQYIQLIREAKGLEVRFIPEGFPEKINEGAQKDIAAVVRLLVENVLRHALATEMAITMKLDKEHFSIEVKDNGKGFISKGDSDGKGLANARSRAERLGGTFTIASQPHKGTTAVLTVPLNTL